MALDLAKKKQKSCMKIIANDADTNVFSFKKMQINIFKSKRVCFFHSNKKKQIFYYSFHNSEQFVKITERKSGHIHFVCIIILYKFLPYWANC